MHALLHMGHTNYLKEKEKKKKQRCHSSCGGENINTSDPTLHTVMILNSRHYIIPKV